MTQVKKKGNRYEAEIAKKYVDYEVDPKATRMPMSGADVYLKGDIRHVHREPLPRFVDECKSGKRISWYEWWQQTKGQCHTGEEPLLHFKKDYKESLTLLKTDTFFEIIGQLVALYDEQQKTPDQRSGVNSRQLQYDAKTIKDKANKILRELGS